MEGSSSLEVAVGLTSALLSLLVSEHHEKKGETGLTLDSIFW